MNILLSNEALQASINTKGAELQSLKSHGREYIWDGNPEFWGKHSPILFPIVGTLKDNSFSYEDKKFELSRHGFARDREFEVLTSSNTSAVFSLTSSKETFQNYPFDFELRVIYTLDENRLKITYQVKNNSHSKMPFAIGGHPAFALPESFEDYALLFEKQEILKTFELQNDLVSDVTQDIELQQKKLPLNYSLFEKDALILKNLESKTIEILEKQKPILKFSFADFPNFGIWTKANAPFICLEPWIGYSDTNDAAGNLFEKEGIIVLEKKQSFEASFEIEIF